MRLVYCCWAWTREAVPASVIPLTAPPLAGPNPVYPLIPRRTFTHKHQLLPKSVGTDFQHHIGVFIPEDEGKVPSGTPEFKEIKRIFLELFTQ